MKDHHRRRGWDSIAKKWLLPAEVLSVLMLIGRVDMGTAEDKENSLGRYHIDSCAGVCGDDYKLIYENDLCLVENENGSKVWQVVYESNKDYPAFDFEGWDSESNGISESLACAMRVTVIGNIHENHELLEER